MYIYAYMYIYLYTHMYVHIVYARSGKASSVIVDKNH